MRAREYHNFFLASSFWNKSQVAAHLKLTWCSFVARVRITMQHTIPKVCLITLPKHTHVVLTDFAFEFDSPNAIVLYRIVPELNYQPYWVCLGHTWPLLFTCSSSPIVAESLLSLSVFTLCSSLSFIICSLESGPPAIHKKVIFDSMYYTCWGSCI